MPDKGTKLNERVWKLFAGAGFFTRPSKDSPDEHVVKLPGRSSGRRVDLYAKVSALGVTIVGENKACKEFDKSFSRCIHDLAAIATAAGADKALFVSTEKEITKDDKKFAALSNVVTWQKHDLKYYEAIVRAIGADAKYEILRALGISTDEQTPTHNILAIKLSQPYANSGVHMYMFTAHPEFLLKTCAVLRRAQGDALAYQRILRKERLSKILQFVTKADALLPPNIIVHLGDDVNYSPIDIPRKDSSGRSINLFDHTSYQLGVLAIPATYASLEIIDGQHRLYGFSASDPATRDNFNLVVLGIQGLTSQKRKDTFIAINDKARRVDPNLVAYLKRWDNEVECQSAPELMAIRLVVLLNEESPFRGRIRLVDIGDGVITLKGFCGYDLRSLVGPKGRLRLHYPSNTSTDYLRALRLYFSLVKSHFKTEWNDPRKYIVCTNRGISAFLKLLKSILKTVDGTLDKERIDLYLAALAKNWPLTWEIAKLRSSYVGSQGWKDFHRDMIKAIRKSHKDFEE